MLKTEIRVKKKGGLYYIVDDQTGIRQCKPWLGDAFAFLYDFIMQRSIFPKKFGGDMALHYETLGHELQGVQGKRVLELATGSGSAVHFLPPDNRYAGTDISPGLLKQAVKRFRTAGFENADFYVASADDLPFADNLFDLVLCILSLNFFNDIASVMKEVKRVMVPGAVFFCSVPVANRNRRQSKIRGTLHSEEALKQICSARGFRFESIPCENGALFYFKAIAK